MGEVSRGPLGRSVYLLYFTDIRGCLEMAEVDAAAEERRKRAQARKDKIAGRGADRLAKITGAAKGEGGEGERFGTGGSSSRE
jgi:hypothetical protein